MRVISRFVLVILFVLLAVGPAIAEGNIARVSYWKVKAGAEAQLEAGIVQHNKIHVTANDPNPIFTGIIVSGNHQGEWVRGSAGHDWADFDAGQSEEDVADSAIHLDPYIESSRTVFYAHQTDISNDMDGGAPLAQIIYFHIKPGHEQVFRGAVTKIHEALAEQESWPAYNWYTVADGGKQPTWLVVLERENWAAFEPGDPEFGAVMAAKFGEEETGKIFEQLFSVVTGQYSHTIAFPPELSYTPGAE